MNQTKKSRNRRDRTIKHRRVWSFPIVSSCSSYEDLVSKFQGFFIIRETLSFQARSNKLLFVDSLSRHSRQRAVGTVLGKLSLAQHKWQNLVLIDRNPSGRERPHTCAWANLHAHTEEDAGAEKRTIRIRAFSYVQSCSYSFALMNLFSHFRAH
jgi:predicted dithiol-disulfide oxidoreductase (DUF899 family)